MMSFLSPYKLLMEIIVIGALAGGVAWGVHQFLEHERDIGRKEVQARWDTQTAKDVETARAETERLAKVAEVAEKNGATREQTIRTLAAAAGTASLGLRDTITTISGSMSNATADALRSTITAYGDVLKECSGRRRAVAEEAERINSEKQTLIEAWPRNSTPNTEAK